MTYFTCILEFVQTIIHLTQISRQTIRLLVCCPTVYLRERWLDNPRILGAKSGTLYLSETSGNESGSIGVQYPQTSQWRLTKYKTHTLHSSFDHAYLMKLKLVRMTLCIVITNHVMIIDYKNWIILWQNQGVRMFNYRNRFEYWLLRSEALFPQSV